MEVNIKEPGAAERKAVSRLVETFLFRRLKGPSTKPPAALGPRAFTAASPNKGRLAATHYPAPHGHPKGVVVLAHPHKRYAQHWFVRTGWVQWLLGQGFSVVTFDFSRYGRSRGGDPFLHDQVIAVAKRAQHLEPGTPIHLVGVSIGSFAVANAAPRLDFVDSITLESPYPRFADWYQRNGDSRILTAINATLGRLFPTTYARIDATRNIPHAKPPRILIIGMKRDRVTAIDLTRAVVNAAPPRARYLEIDGPDHLEGFAKSEAYRAAVLAQFTGGPPAGTPARTAPGKPLPTPVAAPDRKVASDRTVTSS